MARQRTQEVSIPDEYADFVEVDGEAEDISDLQGEIDKQLDTIFAEFGGDPNETEFKINIYRTIPNRAELEWCFSCLPHELPITERIRDEFGPGEYEIRVYRNGKIFRKRKMHVAKPISQPRRPEAEGNSLKDILLYMQQQQEKQFTQMQQLFQQSITRPEPTPINPMDQMMQQMTMMKMMKEIMGSSNNDSLGLKDVMELAKEFSDLGGGERNSSDVLFKLVETAMPALIDGAKNSQQVPQPMPRSQQPIITTPVKPSADVRLQNPISENQPKETPEMMLQAMVRAKLPELIKLAEADKDPGLYAEVVMDNVPDMFIEKYLTFIQASDCVEVLGRIDPRVNTYIKWFEAYRDESLRIIAESLEDGGENLTNGEVINQTPGHESTES